MAQWREHSRFTSDLDSNPALCVVSLKGFKASLLRRGSFSGETTRKREKGKENGEVENRGRAEDDRKGERRSNPFSSAYTCFCPPSHPPAYRTTKESSKEERASLRVFEPICMRSCYQCNAYLTELWCLKRWESRHRVYNKKIDERGGKSERSWEVGVTQCLRRVGWGW